MLLIPQGRSGGHSEAESDIARLSEASEDKDVLDNEPIEEDKEEESSDLDIKRKSVSFQKNRLNLSLQINIWKMNKEDYITREEYTSREWMGKPVSDWIDYAYVNIPNIPEKYDNLAKLKCEQDSLNQKSCNKFDFPYMLQVVKDVYCRNNLEKLKFSSLAKTYAKRIAVADGSKNCKFCGGVLSSSSVDSSYLSGKHCCDKYHRLFRLAVSYAEMLYKHYHQQRRKYYDKQKSSNLKENLFKDQLMQSELSAALSTTESLDKTVSRLSLSTKGLDETVSSVDQIKDEMTGQQKDSNLQGETIENSTKVDAEVESASDTIIYQLSNCKYIEEGWTISHADDFNNDVNLVTIDQARKSLQLDYDALIVKRHLPTDLSAFQLDFIQQEYSNGEVFLRKYNDDTGVIFYSTGNPAILFLPQTVNTNSSNDNDSRSLGLLFIVHDQLDVDMTRFTEKERNDKHKRDTSRVVLKINNNKNKKKNSSGKTKKSGTLDVQSTVGKLIGVFDTNIHGVVYDRNNNIRLEYNPDGGTYFGETLTSDKYAKIRKWRWSGETHVHAPPFQPLIMKLNNFITLKVHQLNKIYLHFHSMKSVCKVDLSCKQLKIRCINIEQHKH
ncbi:unnamed protein product [Heterobilharzia americana]|nr:unnamed protein product [Heterobilharzia americana]